MKNLLFMIGLTALCIPSLQAAVSLGNNLNLETADKSEFNENIKLKDMTLTCISHIKNCQTKTSKKVGTALFKQKSYTACIIKDLYPLVKNGNLIAPAYIAQAYHTLGLEKDYKKWLQYFEKQEALSSKVKQEVITRLES